MGAFHHYGNELTYLAEYYQKYDELMMFWHDRIDEQTLMTIEYESLVTEAENQIRQLLNFIGLSYESQCLEFHTQQRAVKTLSKDQVRNPIYTSSLEPWKGIESYIKPLMDAFGDS